MPALPVEVIVKILTRAEERLAAKGQPIQGLLCALTIQPSGVELRISPIAGNLSASALADLAYRYKTDAQGSTLMLQKFPGLYGILYIADGWLAPERETREEYEELLALYSSIPEIPGSMRSRALNAIDLDGRSYNLVVHPDGLHAGTSEWGDSVGGSLFLSLKAIMESVALRLPDGGRAITALSKLKITPLADMPSTPL